jgi:hypothetical protein
MKCWERIAPLLSSKNHTGKYIRIIHEYSFSAFLVSSTQSVIRPLLHPDVARRPYLQFWYGLSFLFSEPQGWDATDVLLPWDWVTASHGLRLSCLLTAHHSPFYLVTSPPCRLVSRIWPTVIQNEESFNTVWNRAGYHSGKPTESSSEGFPFTSSGTPAAYPGIYRGFPQSLQANTVVISRLGHDHFLANHFPNGF